MSREWTQRDYQKSWFTGNLKERKNEAVPGEPGKMEYIQPWMKEISEWANGTIEGNGIWKSEGVVRRFKTALYTGYTQKNGAVSKVNKKCISRLTRTQRTPSAAATVQVSHALPAVRFSCLLRGRGASFQDGVAVGKGFPCSPFWGVQIWDYSAWEANCMCVFSKPCTKLTLHCNHRSGHLKTEHTESFFLLRRHLGNWLRGLAVSMRSELLVAHEKLGQLPLLTVVYVVPV